MGLMTGSGCLSRVLGPVFVSYIYTRMGTNWTFGMTTGMMVFALISLWIYRDRLYPPDISKTVEMQQMGQIGQNGSLEEKEKLHSTKTES
jgi:MFS transporter, ceroid-lipofuscinosis neuronal protein 7